MAINVWVKRNIQALTVIILKAQQLWEFHSAKPQQKHILQIQCQTVGPLWFVRLDLKTTKNRTTNHSSSFNLLNLQKLYFHVFKSALIILKIIHTAVSTSRDQRLVEGWGLRCIKYAGMCNIFQGQYRSVPNKYHTHSHGLIKLPLTILIEAWEIICPFSQCNCEHIKISVSYCISIAN